MSENQTSETDEARPAVASTDGLDDLPGALLLAKGVAEQKWPHTVDARAWADEWLRTLKEHPEIATDRDTMIGWFANSIMAGYDTAMFRSSNAAHERPRSSAWLAGAPEVSPGHRRNFLVTVEGHKGRRYVTTAYYANEYYLAWHEDYRPDDDEADGKKWTGWQSDRIDRWGDEVTMAFEGNVIGYMPLPAPANACDMPRR